MLDSERARRHLDRRDHKGRQQPRAEPLHQRRGCRGIPLATARRLFGRARRDRTQVVPSDRHSDPSVMAREQLAAEDDDTSDGRPDLRTARNQAPAVKCKERRCLYRLLSVPEAEQTARRRKKNGGRAFFQHHTVFRLMIILPKPGFGAYWIVEVDCQMLIVLVRIWCSMVAGAAARYRRRGLPPGSPSLASLSTAAGEIQTARTSTMAPVQQPAGVCSAAAWTFARSLILSATPALLLAASTAPPGVPHAPSRRRIQNHASLSFK